MKASAQEEFYRKLGESIRKQRKKRGLSQDALARLVGLTRTSLTNIESGRQHPPVHTFCEIAKQLEVEFSELLPRPLTTLASVDVETLAGAKVRGQNELAFIETAIGIKGRSPHGNTATKDRSDSTGASR